MKKLLMKIIMICLMLGFLVNCTSINVKPVTVKDKIDTICVCNNPKVTADFLKSLKSEFGYYGIKLRTFNNTGFEDEYPKEIVEQCEYIMTYTAKYTWDLAVYCWYFELHLFQGEVEVANAVFELEGMGGFDMTKFDSTENKIRKLLKEFLVNYPYVIEPPKSPIVVESNVATKIEKDKVSVTSGPKYGVIVNPNEPWTGTWKVTGGNHGTFVLKLKQSGNTVKSIRGSERSFKGKVKGDRLKGWRAKSSHEDRYDLKLSGDFTSFQGSQSIPQNINKLKGERLE